MIKYLEHIKHYVIMFGKKYVSKDAEGNLSLSDKENAAVFRKKSDARGTRLKYLKLNNGKNR